MSILSRLRNIFNPQPKEQVLGYSPEELKEIFQNSIPAIDSEVQKNTQK